MAARPSKRSPKALPSKIASSAKLLTTASRSRRFAASSALPTSSTRSGVVDSCDIARPVSRAGLAKTNTIMVLVAEPVKATVPASPAVFCLDPAVYWASPAVWGTTPALIDADGASCTA